MTVLARHDLRGRRSQVKAGAQMRLRSPSTARSPQLETDADVTFAVYSHVRLSWVDWLAPPFHFDLGGLCPFSCVALRNSEWIDECVECDAVQY